MEKKFSFTIGKEKKTVIISRDIVGSLLGLVFIVASALLLGLFEVFKIGWDFSILKNSSFWVSYLVKLAMLYLAFFGAYIIRKQKNLKSPKVLMQREILRHNKREIANSHRTADYEFWLKAVYSYSKKVELYQKRLQEKNANLSIVEPTEIKKSKGIFYKVKVWQYKRAMKRYTKNRERRMYYEEQLKNCEIHLQVIELYMQRKIQEGKELLESIENDGFQLFMPRYKAVTYNKIFNVSIEASKEDREEFSYREKSILLQKITKSVAIGCLSIAVMTSLALDFKAVSFQSAVYMLMNVITMLWFAYNGIKSADILVFGSMMQADANRIKVSNLYRDNCLQNGDSWANALKDTEEKREDERI